MSDVDMLDISSVSSPLPTASSALAQHHSTDEHNSNGRSEPSSISIPVLLNQPNVVEVTGEPSGGTSRPTASASAKPKSAKAPKPRSPSPSPPPPPAPPLQTIRLSIRLGGPDNYEVDIAAIARANGLRPPTPIPTKRDTSESEGEPEPEQDGVKLKRKRKNAAAEYYDVSDPFIDDSELAVDERKFFAQTKQQGFYVSSGEVALLKDKTTTKKPKKKPPTDPGPSNQDGTKDAPISLGSDGESAQPTENAGQKRKRYLTLVEGGKKRKVVDIASFHPEIQQSVEVLKQAIANENWSIKGKFPPGLKPLLADLAILAIKHDEYDEHFFNLMPVLFPYNKFTMSKLIKRTVFQEHTGLLMQRQEALLSELAQLAREGFARAEEEWERSVMAWDKRQEKAKADSASTASGMVLGTGNMTGTDSAGPTRHPTEEIHDGHGEDGEGRDGERDGEGKDAKGKEHPPAKKFRMTDTMKGIVWKLVVLSNECCRLENEKNTLEGSVLQVSEQGLRKVLYQKIVAAFPEGWMSSGQISRDVSSMKKRFEKEALENEG